MNDYSVVENKLKNFKDFIKKISKNKGPIEQYEGLSMFKLTLFCKIYLEPKRNDLSEVIQKMKKELDFDDEYVEKVERYLNMFIDFICGPLKEEIDSE
jgi:hypothetical protein